jgi:hypothetical protein
MRVDDVIASFIRQDEGRSQNVRSYFRTHKGARYGVLSTYDQPIAIQQENGQLYIDKDTKYTVTSSKHRNAVIAMAKVAGKEPIFVSRAQLRDTIGLDPKEQWKTKLPYRDGTHHGVAPQEVSSVGGKPVKVPKAKQEPQTFHVPAPHDDNEVIVIREHDPFEALRGVIEKGDALMGADVAIVEPTTLDGVYKVTFLDDDGNRLIISEGFGVGSDAGPAMRECLLKSMEHLGFTITDQTRAQVGVKSSPEGALVLLASGHVQTYSAIETPDSATEREEELVEAHEHEVYEVEDKDGVEVVTVPDDED